MILTNFVMYKSFLKPELHIRISESYCEMKKVVGTMIDRTGGTQRAKSHGRTLHRICGR